MIENSFDEYDEWFAKWITEPMKSGMIAPSELFLPVIAYDNPWIYLRELASKFIHAKESSTFNLTVDSYIKSLSKDDLQAIKNCLTGFTMNFTPDREGVLLFVQMILQLEGHFMFYDGESNQEIIDDCLKFKQDVIKLFSVALDDRNKSNKERTYSVFADFIVDTWQPKNIYRK